MSKEQDKKQDQILKESTIFGFVEYLKELQLSLKRPVNVVVMSGAGISTAAGIPDFRSPETGLYANLQKFKLPFAEAIFDIEYFLRKPEAFNELTRELFPGSFKPTRCHHFIKLLETKDFLLRNYTQNIDMLERLAEIKGEKIVEAHGSFHTASCVGSAKLEEMGEGRKSRDFLQEEEESSDSENVIIRIKGCEKKYTLEEFKNLVYKEQVPRCCKCNGLIKPDIVFFGEQLPDRFHKLVRSDFNKADALIVMGTSLTVMPFASLINNVKPNVPRLLINMEEAGVFSSTDQGFDFTGRFQKFRRDAFFKGTCDSGVDLFAELMGWKNDLEALVTKHANTSCNSVSNEPIKTSQKEKDELDQDLSNALSNVKL